MEFFLEDNMSKLMSGSLDVQKLVFFTPLINNVTVFGNYSVRAAQKKILNVVSNCSKHSEVKSCILTRRTSRR